MYNYMFTVLSKYTKCVTFRNCQNGTATLKFKYISCLLLLICRIHNMRVMGNMVVSVNFKYVHNNMLAMANICRL